MEVTIHSKGFIIHAYCANPALYTYDKSISKVYCASTHNHRRIQKSGLEASKTNDVDIFTSYAGLAVRNKQMLFKTG